MSKETPCKPKNLQGILLCSDIYIQYAKHELHMKAINAFVIAEHNKSIALLERLGFTRKQLLKNDTENKGKNADRYWYKLAL